MSMLNSSRLKKTLILSTMTFHFLTIIWKLIPSEADLLDRKFEPFPWLTTTRIVVAKAKSSLRTELMDQIISKYLNWTAMRQHWSLFASNPPIEYNKLSVRPIRNWKNFTINPSMDLDSPELGPELPTHSNHSGHLEDDLAQSSWNKKPLLAFAKYWAQTCYTTAHKTCEGIAIIDQKTIFDRNLETAIGISAVKNKKILCAVSAN